MKPDRFQAGGQRIRCAELRVARIRRTVERGLQTGMRCVIRSLVIPPCVRKQVRKIIRFAVPRIRDKRHVRHNIARHAQGRCGVRLHLRLLPNGLLRLLQVRCILRQIPPDQHARSRQQHHQHACQNFGTDVLHAHPFGALREASNDSARTRITSVTDRAASVYVQPPFAGLVLHDNVKALPFLVIIPLQIPPCRTPRWTRMHSCTGRPSRPSPVRPSSQSSSKHTRGSASANQSSCPLRRRGSRVSARSLVHV